eukprot:comp12458_c0_seq1/m.7393 comp12458_c0_seq1/g.7393  ORF comp12458_c0_seq1/g.7393 comp12458_c0_seq1/m.7393 type:complete len:412 (-) comp12458_c0_seq1:338-1573(-)
MSFRPDAQAVMGADPTESAYQSFLKSRLERQLDDESLEDIEERSFPRTHQAGDLDLSGTDQATLDTPIPKTNVGYRLLEKMGWAEGSGLGRLGHGIKDPIRYDDQLQRMGLGKWQQDMDMAGQALAERRKLDTEVEETEERRARREASAAKQEATEAELKRINEVFHCDICNKGYSKVADWENHLSSYDHHHTKRFKEMKESMKSRSQTQADSVRKKEQRKLEKEMQKLSEFANKQAQAKGTLRVTSTTQISTTQPASEPNEISIPAANVSNRCETSEPPPQKPVKSGFIKGGFTTVTHVSAAEKGGFVTGGTVEATFQPNTPSIQPSATDKLSTAPLQIQQIQKKAPVVRTAAAAFQDDSDEEEGKAPPGDSAPAETAPRPAFGFSLAEKPVPGVKPTGPMKFSFGPKKT